jgi:phosphotransferase system enzyme I (PtsI)
VSDSSKLTGVGASPGVALGPAFVYAPDLPLSGQRRISEESVEGELERFRRAVEVVVRELSGMAGELRERGDEEGAEILAAQAAIAEDPELAAAVEERVAGLEAAEGAVISASEGYAEEIAGSGDEYLAARADDVRDVARQVAAELTGRRGAGLGVIEEPSVVLGRNLTPSETARIREGTVLGFVTAEGSRTSHVAIMARSMGIPAVVGVGEELEAALGAASVAVDGREGVAFADPDPETVSRFRTKLAEAEREAASLDRYRKVEARTRSGRRVEVAANIGSPDEAAGALAWGAEGVGLFRTEFLFMARDELPSEEEQYEVYRAVAETFRGHPVVIRTLDAGGDKDLPILGLPREENPFLGWRGIRMCLETPEIFEPQLRAILRAARHGNLKLMFPMVAEVGELRAAREVLERCREDLRREGKPFGEVEVGAMVETPAAALCAGALAEESDFFSIGTNDLVQYTLAADRGNERLRRLQRADHPAVLKLVRMTCEAARDAGIPVAVCGEAAGNPDLIPTFVELGVAELSMSAPEIPRARKTVSEL